MKMKMKYKVQFKNNDQMKQVGTSFFSEEHGYTTQDTGAIVMLNVRESLELDGGEQRVTRIL